MKDSQLITDFVSFGKMDECALQGSYAPYALFQKRILDVVFAFTALILLLPLLIIISVAIKIDSSGPVFFRQTRFGLNNKPFSILKFRTMYSDASSIIEGGLIQTRIADNRVTKVGAFLRASSFDELPQLINVLAGEMSIVGPRPHAFGMKICGVHYHELVPYYGLRHIVRPGLTGLAQVSGSRGIVETREQAYERLKYDLTYIRDFSTLNDLFIIAKTVLLLLTTRAF